MHLFCVPPLKHAFAFPSLIFVSASFWSLSTLAQPKRSFRCSGDERELSVSRDQRAPHPFFTFFPLFLSSLCVFLSPWGRFPASSPPSGVRNQLQLLSLSRAVCELFLELHSCPRFFTVLARAVGSRPLAPPDLRAQVYSASTARSALAQLVVRDRFVGARHMLFLFFVLRAHVFVCWRQSIMLRSAAVFCATSSKIARSAMR